MTEAEETALNGAIADAFFGWDHKENGMWADPTGDEYPLPPNYTDNSGLVVGLEYKLRKRGFSLDFAWSPAQPVKYTVSNDATGDSWVGSAETKSMAICLAIQQMLEAGVK
jgi:hypothetical protein